MSTGGGVQEYSSASRPSPTIAEVPQQKAPKASAKDVAAGDSEVKNDPQKNKDAPNMKGVQNNKDALNTKGA